MAKLVSRTNLIDMVYHRISEMIMDGVITPGGLINRPDLARHLGVSQTPVNETINRMQGEGLVIRIPGKGFYLKEYSLQDQADFFAARAGIEGIAVRLCLERLDEEGLQNLGSYFDLFNPPIPEDQLPLYRHQDHVFHEQLLLQSNNTVLKEFNLNYSFIVKCYLQGLIRPPEETLDEHRAISEAIIHRRADRAAELVTHHHMATRDSLLAKNQTA